ncbi:MAG: hypothetical protein OQK24_15105 [Magnetovibrio sp.]|nr:hypothetical protein [Magnetovibrio sp.]
MKTTITFDIDTENLASYSDEYLAKLWYIAQANHAPMEDREAGQLAEHIGREIIRRWILESPVPLWDRQGHHATFCELITLKEQTTREAS